MEAPVPAISDCRVLAIQSHVVSGYVGNKCAVFPLQLHGLEVDAINSVQFSNHTAYPQWKGQVLSSRELWELYEGLQVNDLNRNYTHLLTGYVAENTFLDTIRDIVVDIKFHSPALFYICDPVLGDNGSYYVPEVLSNIYRDRIIPLADVVTPNQFELECLSGVRVDSERSALSAVDILHSFGPKHVVVTSSSLGDSDTLIGYGSTAIAGTKKRFRFETARFSESFLGTGDVFTALLLIWMLKTNGDLKQSVEKVLASIRELLVLTIQSAKKAAGPDAPPTPAQLELRLVQGQEQILHPKTPIKIVEL